MSRQELLDIYDRHYNPTLARLFDVADCPVEATASGVHVMDEDGRSYLDFAAGYGVFSLGHLDARVQAAAQRQLETLPMLPVGVPNEPADALVRTLTELLPGDLDHVLLAGSGSEAIEIALRTALLARPRHSRLVASQLSYHGKTLGALGVMGQKHLRAPFEPLWPDTQFVPFGDVDAMATAVGRGAVAVILEPVLGGGYLVVPPVGYLTEVAEICRRTGTLFIVDEVQTGFGRTGTMFSIGRENIVPDMVVLSKGMTGGHVPMAAVAVRASLVAGLGETLWRQNQAHASDASGSLLACATAKVAIDVIVERKLPQRAAQLGAYLLGRLRAVAEMHNDWVKDVPGCGLMTGIELRSGIAEYAVWLQLLERGVLAGFSTNSHARTPVLRFFPPLTIGHQDIDRAIDALSDSLTALDRKPTLLYDLANAALPLQYRLPKSFLRLVTRALLS